MSPTGHISPCAHLLEPEIRELVREGAFSELRHALQGVHPADIADILTELGPDDAALAFRFLPRDDAGEVFGYLSQEYQEQLITTLGQEQAVRVVEGMSADDRVRILDELPHEVAQRLVASLSPESRKVTQAILGYPPRSVGRLMTPDYIRIRPEWTVQQALDHIRRYGQDAETINVVYVVDPTGVLIDDLRLRSILLADPSQTVESIMNRQFVTLKADEDRSEAVAAMARYDRTALPVIDSRGVLLGIVTHDDVADVAQLEATEDMQMMGGVAALEEPFDRVGVISLVRKRAPWLSLLFLSELLTSNALRYYDDQIAKVVILSAFVPAIISSGGNSGSQASTLVIRALALNEVSLKDWWRILRREFLVAGVLGAMIGSLGFIRICIWGWAGWWTEKSTDPATGEVIIDSRVQEHFYVLATAIMTALFGVVLWGSIMGAMLPFILKKCKLDPAGSSTPFVATLVDVTGIIIYFTCMNALLRGTLL
ncbi:MAG TPA: magnesium transporter [Phycisphaerales bacterium]|nr:magnesium transporter [Phycisphaerales bacterium]